MEEFMTFDQLRECLYPEHLRASSDTVTAQKLAAHCEDLWPRVKEIEQSIQARFSGKERETQKKIFYKNLLCIADEWILTETFPLRELGLNLAASVVSEGGDVDHVEKIFDEFEDQANMLLLEFEMSGQHEKWAKQFIDAAGAFYEAAARIPVEKERPGFHERAVNWLLAAAENGLEHYQGLILNYYSIYCCPEEYPAGKEILISSYDRLSTVTKILFAGLQKKKDFQALSDFATESLNLAAAMIVHFHDEAEVKELALPALQEAWGILFTLEADIADGMIKATDNAYKMHAANPDASKSIRQGSETLSQLIGLLINGTTQNVPPPRDDAHAAARKRALAAFAGAQLGNAAPSA